MSQPLTRHNRPRQVLDAITSANAGLSEEDREAKYAKLAESPYQFFRGTNHLYWDDVWHDWRFASTAACPRRRPGCRAMPTPTTSAPTGIATIPCAMAWMISTTHDRRLPIRFVAAGHQLVLDARENVGLSRKAIGKALATLTESYHDELAGHLNGEAPDGVTLDTAKGPVRPFSRRSPPSAVAPGCSTSGRV